MRHSSTCRRALTLTDLLIVLTILALLAGAFLPALVLRTASRGDNRVKCASNLKQIGLAMIMYANDNKGNFPRTIYEPADPTPRQFTGSSSPDSFKPGGPEANDVTAALFLVLKTQDLTSEVFLCPYDESTQRLNAIPTKRSNFPEPSMLSYSYMNPYPSAAARAAGLKLNFTLSSDFAIAADMNPGGPALLTTPFNAPPQQMTLLNSPNHRGDGQNVLYADGHVEYQSSPFAGMARSPARGQPFRDNIFTSGGGDSGAAEVVVGPPADPKDSVLLPVAPGGPARGAAVQVIAVSPATWLFTAGILLLTSTALIVFLSLRRPATRHQDGVGGAA